MAQNTTSNHKLSSRLSVFALSMFLLLAVGNAHTAPQPVIAQAQAWGIPVSEPALEPEGRLAAVTPDPMIQELIDQVNTTTLMTYDRQLAGELPVWVDSGWYTITTRYTYSVTIQKATSFVGQHMTNLGLDVEYHVWNSITNPNVIGEMPGLGQPERIFIIGAHLDDVSGTPGADDNASGSVATLVAADIFNQYKWDCTLRFAFWTGEEQGMLGSKAYAQRSYSLGEDIEGYLNLDMIAYNTIGTPHDIDLMYKTSLPPTHDLALLFMDVVSAYGINLIPELRTSMSGGSDHSSFWTYGYTAILAIEDDPEDFNPWYHGPGDTPAHIDPFFFADFVKASLGTFAHMGCLLPPTGNLAGTVTDASGAPIASVQVQAQLTPEQGWETVTNLDGMYVMHLLSGTYTVTAQAPGYMNFATSGIVVANEYTTTLDITLLVTPTANLTGTVTNAENAPIAFAQVQAQLTPEQQWETLTNLDGMYAMQLLSGTYTVTAQAPDYLDYSTSGVVVSDGYTTTLDITLLFAPTFTLTGTVRDELTGEPLSATISVTDSPITHTHTDPTTGQYTITLAQGTYTLVAEHPYYHSQTVTVDLQGNQEQDFNLASICLLVVGDDAQYASYYTATLDRLGYNYLYIDQSPSLEALSYFQAAIWLTGDQPTNTLTQSDQITLATYLEGGGRLFISGQNIGQDIGSSSFFKEYLHASFLEPDVDLYALSGLGFLNPLPDISIHGGDGANNQSSPDAITPAEGGEAVFQYWADPLSEPVLYGGVAFTGTQRIVYFSFGFEAINLASDRDQVLQAVLDFLEPCTPRQAPQAGFTVSPGAGGGFHFSNTSQGTPLMSYTWDFGDGSPTSSQANPAYIYAQSGYYTITLTVTNRYGQDTASLIVFVPLEVYLPVVEKE